MDRNTEIRLINEVLALRDKGETQNHESTQSHSIERYVSEEWFELEKERLFLKKPMFLGVANEVPNIGDYRAIEWVNGLSLLMVRGSDNEIRVFANACRHRNARLIANGESGCKKRFSCPYHAWTYDTEGKLAGAPEFENGFGDLDKKALGLVEFHTRVINGAVFVSLDPQARVPEDVVASETASGFKYLDLENQRVYKRRSYVLNANWKILSEGGIEAYHFNVAHRNTLAPFFLGNLSTWESWGGRDMRMILPKKPMLDAKDMPVEQWDMRKFANVFYTMAPTMALLAQPDNISIIKMIPKSPGQTLMEEVLLVDPPKDGSDEFSEEETKLHEINYHLVHKILSEDWVLGETIQANMEGGAVKEIYFGRFESALTWFHNQYERELGIKAASKLAP